METSIIYRADRPYVTEIAADESSEVAITMDLGTVHYIYLADVDSSSASDACRLTGTPVDDGNLIIYGYVAPYEDTDANEYRCGVLLRVDEDSNSYEDSLSVVLTGGDADIDIAITIDYQSKANEYVVLALPRAFVN